MAERSHHAGRAPQDSPSLHARCPNPVGKGQCSVALPPTKPLSGQHKHAWEKQVWAREAHGSGAEGNWPDWKPLSQQEEGEGELACCSSASLLQQQGILASQKTAPELFGHQRE